MERTIPILACIALIYFLLKMERKQAPQVSRALWLPTLWMLYHASKPLARWLAPYGLISVTGDEIETGSAVDRNFLLLLIFFGVIVLRRRGLNWGEALRQNNWLVLLLGYLLISCIWSPVPLGSLKQWFRVFGSFVMALLVLTEANPDQAMESILVRTVYVLIPLSVVLVKWVPELGVDYGRWLGERTWEGACLQKNGLGRLCLVSAVVMVWRFARYWKGRRLSTSRFQMPAELLVFLMVCYLIKGPGAGAFSATAVGVVLLCSTILLGLLLPRVGVASKIYGTVSVFTLALAVLLTYISITGMVPSLVTGVFGRDATFTGRTEIWQELRSHGWEHPILGAGYHGFWGQRRPNSPHLSEINEGHNGYLDVFVATGFVGLALFLLFLVAFLRRAKMDKICDFDWAVFKLVFLLMALIHNFTETSFLRSTAHLWVLFIFLFAHRSDNYTKTETTVESPVDWNQSEDEKQVLAASGPLMGLRS